MFIILAIMYSLIIFITLFGNYDGKELEKQKQEWERIMGRKYY